LVRSASLEHFQLPRMLNKWCLRYMFTFFRLQLVYPFWSCQKYSQSHRSNPGSGLDAPSLSSLVGSHSIWFAFCALKILNLSKHLPA
jgi:hypothetical protein